MREDEIRTEEAQRTVCDHLVCPSLSSSLPCRLEDYNSKGRSSECAAGSDHAHTDTPPSCTPESTGTGGGSYKPVKSISVSTVSHVTDKFLTNLFELSALDWRGSCDGV